MKKIKMFLSLLIVVIIATTFNACTKGDTGPQGSAGANGYNGNANVNTQTFTISSWSFNSPSYSASVTDYDITQDIVDNGAVMVYVSNGSGGWQPLPLTGYPTSTYSSTYTTVHALYTAAFYKTDSDLTQPASPGALSFKVVAIAGLAYKKHATVNWRNYEEVKAAFHLKD